MPHNPQPGDVLVSLTNGKNMETNRRAISLRIEDGPTGRTLVEADMDGPQFANLVTSSNVEVGGYSIQIARYLGGGGAVKLTVCNSSSRRIIVRVDIGGEEFAAILGNKVTRLSGAQIYAQNVEG